MSWFGCSHDWQIKCKTYAPPGDHGLASVNHGGEGLLNYIERARCGVTTVVMTCSKCGQESVTEMLGKE